MKVLTKIAIAAGAVALATTAMAQPKPENFVKQRQSAFALMGWYFGPLAAVAKGEKPFNKDDAVRATSYLVPLSKMPWEGVVAGTENVGNTKAKPEIWSDSAGFAAAAAAFRTQAGAMQAAAQSGDKAAVAAQVGPLFGACRTCHTAYRAQ